MFSVTHAQANDIAFCPANCSCFRRRTSSAPAAHVTNDARPRDRAAVEQLRVTCRNRQIGDLDWLNDDRFPPNITHLWVVTFCSAICNLELADVFIFHYHVSRASHSESGSVNTPRRSSCWDTVLLTLTACISLSPLKLDNGSAQNQAAPTLASVHRRLSYLKYNDTSVCPSPQTHLDPFSLFCRTRRCIQQIHTVTVT